MAVLSFSLSSEATNRFHELLACLAKFGDMVSIEARSEKFTVTALNLSKTAYASFALDAGSFFLDYEFNASSSAKGGDRFTCQLLNRALQAVFKGRTSDSRGRDAVIERCDVSIEDDPDKTECRLIVKMLSKHGMTKTYRLTYESVEVMHALFDRTAATQGWKVSSRVLREYIEYFGPKTEQLDIVAADGKATFTSFTEKVQDGNQVLKQPLETAIAIHIEDFEDFHMQTDMHIVINVKDFRAIVTHAETLRTPMSAYFSHPSRPLQFSYQNFGMHCQFTLTTHGDLRESSTPNPKFLSTRSISRQPSFTPGTNSRAPSAMPPPARPSLTKPLSSSSQRSSLREQVHAPSRADSDHDPDLDSLFIPMDNGEEDQGWDPATYDQDEEDEMLGWDTSLEDPNAALHSTFRDSDRPAGSSRRGATSTSVTTEGVEPTQRLSELRGLFD